MQQEKTCPRLSIRVIDYTGDRLEERECIELTEAWSWLSRETVTWIDIVGVPEHGELVELGRQAGIHPLTMEDIAIPDQRPKVEEFGSYIAVIVRMLSVEGGRVASEQVSLIFGKNYVITFREQRFHVFDHIRERLKNEQSALRYAGPDFLTYTLLDAIVSVYLAILDGVDDQVEDLQSEVLASTDRSGLRRIYALKERLVIIRRAVMPAREVLGSLAGRESGLIRRETVPYFRDAYDRCIQAAEIAEYSRDTLAGVMDLYTSNQSNHQAEIVTFLTIVATIFIPLSFIAGYYGMNFENMPFVTSPWGYYIVILLMAGTAHDAPLLQEERVDMTVTRGGHRRPEGDAVVESDLPLIARIGEDPAVGEADLARTPIAGIPQESPARAVVRALAGWLVEECARQGK